MPTTDVVHITPTVDGPYQVKGPIHLAWPSGHVITTGDMVKLCRCGHSEDKPFCDGTHAKIGFKSKEGDDTAHRG